MSTSEEYFVLDWQQQARRLTHYPSGDTCIRPDWMYGELAGKWDAELSAFFARHPDASEIRNPKTRVLDNVANIPQSGGGFRPGDCVVFMPLGEDADWSRQITVAIDISDKPAYEGAPIWKYVLDSGEEVRWDPYSFGWFAYDGPTDNASRQRVRKLFEGEVVPTYDEVHAEPAMKL